LRLWQSAVGLTNQVKYDVLTWKGQNHKEREVKQQVPKEMRSYSTRRICRRIPDRYSSTYYALDNLLRQDSFAMYCMIHTFCFRYLATVPFGFTDCESFGTYLIHGVRRIWKRRKNRKTSKILGEIWFSTFQFMTKY
jgi:hypothetical protein